MEKNILKEWNHDQDHIQVLFSAQPNSELSKFINAYKSASSRIIKKEFHVYKLWKSSFCSKSYCLLTVGGAPLEILKEYIKSQGSDKNASNLQISHLPYERTKRKIK
ncbi:putative transposase [Marinitoga litoralis]|nr:putative transposase [Marinitoga litoralis]